jgi:hypothetical protein
VRRTDAVTTTREAGPGATPFDTLPFRVLGAVFSVTALLVLLVGVRLAQRGRWLPEVPPEIGAWTVSEKPLSRIELGQYGYPNTRGWSYKNAFNEEVEVQLISTSSFESYLDPRIAMGNFNYGVTAERRFPLFGKDGSVRALLFRRPDGNRALLYHWIQYKSGRTNSRDSIRQSRDFLPRLRLGVGATVDGTQNCIVRVSTKIHQADIQGLQARRNLNEICLKLHEEIVRSSKGGR